MNDPQLVPMVLPIVLTAAVAGIGYLLRYIDTLKTKAMETRLAAHDKAIEALTAMLTALAERLRIDEVTTVRLEGRVALTEANHGGLEKDLEEIKSTMREIQRSMAALIAAVGSKGFSPPSSGSSPRNEAVRR